MGNIIRAGGNPREIIVAPESVAVIENWNQNRAFERPRAAQITTGELLEVLLREKRSAATRAAYSADLKHFYLTFREGTARLPKGTACLPEELLGYLGTFISWPREDIRYRMLEYKAAMIEAQFAEATVERRRASIVAFLRCAYQHGKCETDGRGLVQGEKVRKFREIGGLSPKQVRELLAAITTKHGAGTEAALRDEAIVRLMFGVGLRRAEVVKLDVRDFSPSTKRIWVLGKGRGTQKESLEVPPKAVATILAYLEKSGHLAEKETPLFRNFDHRPRYKNQRLTLRAINHLMEKYGALTGFERLHPHMLRHTFGTQLSEKTNGNVPAVQRAMRHADANTTMRYIEQAQGVQGKMVRLLEEEME